MKAILVREPGGVEQLYVGEVQAPTPEADELLVRVATTALNRADLMQREGRYPPPAGASEILGLEMAGIVERVGEACTGWRVGDRVFGLLPGGGYAEYAVLHQRMAMPMPRHMSFEDAAAIPEVFLTAYQALFWLGKLERAQHVLIHAGASGVGTAALQLAKRIGAYAYVTASARKHRRCLELGADRTIDYAAEDFSDRILAFTDGRGVDLVLDFIGASYFKQNIRSLAMDGRMVILAMMGGSSLEEVDLHALFRRRLQIITSTLRSRSPGYKIDLTQDFFEQIGPLLETRRIFPVIDTVFPWTDVRKAHRYMQANRNIGKIVLRVSDMT